MNLIEIIKHNNQLILNKEVSLAEVYGKENFCYLIYSLIKMQKPETIIELGTGLGTTALMIAQALKENNKGKIWTVDNGKDWEETKTSWIKTKFKTHEDYFNDVIKAQKKYKNPSENEKLALQALVKTLEQCNDQMSPEDIQTLIYSTGKENGYAENLRDWFKLIYEVVFGDENGPRMGFFISFFGVNETKELIISKLK